MQQWQQLRLKYGTGLPEDHLQIMFHGILPEHVSKEVRAQRDLDTLAKQVSWVNAELTCFNDVRLWRWNMTKLAQLLKGGQKHPMNVSQVSNENHDEVEQPVAPPPVSDMASFQANLERMIAAALNQEARGRSGNRTPQGYRSGTPRRSNIRSPKFNGCWCCGANDHSRQKCPKCQAIKDNNGGKVPKDYEGAYDKSLKNTPV